MAHRVSLWFLLCAVPAAKSWHVTHKTGWTDAERQIAIAIIVAAASYVLVATAGGGDGGGVVKRWLLAVGLWPDRDVEYRSSRVVAWCVGIVGVVAAVVACLRFETATPRWVFGGVAAACVLTVTIWETVRYHWWRRTVSVVKPPERALLWTTVPLTLSALGTAVALAVQDVPGHLVGGRLVEVVLVTALGEEFIFRGCLLVLAYRVLRPVAAHVAVAASFGLWHVGDAWEDAAGAPGARALQIVCTVLLTFVAGLVLTFLRHRSRSLAGPVLAHVGTNMPGKALFDWAA